MVTGRFRAAQRSRTPPGRQNALAAVKSDLINASWPFPDPGTTAALPLITPPDGTRWLSGSLASYITNNPGWKSGPNL
jgi:hypothetical protein